MITEHQPRVTSNHNSIDGDRNHPGRATGWVQPPKEQVYLTAAAATNLYVLIRDIVRLLSVQTSICQVSSASPSEC